MARARSSATGHLVSGSAWIAGGLAACAYLAANQAPFVSLWLVGVFLLALGAVEVGVGLRARRLAAAPAGVGGNGSPPATDDGTLPAGQRRLEGGVNVGYGAVGLLVGVAFLFLNLSGPADASPGDWFWCAAGFVVGASLLRHGLATRGK